MTYIKEKLQDALDNIAMGYMSHNIQNVPDSPCLIFAHEHQADAVAEAATLLQKYAAALDMAERALVSIKWESADRDNMEFKSRITYVRMDEIQAALTTIRKIKGGE